jgi:hypothetical protein
MAEPEDKDVAMTEDEYDEEADSDFEQASNQSEGSKSSSEDELDIPAQPARRTKKPQATSEPATEPTELDSGDEATIKEHKKARKRRQKKGEDVEDDDGNESEGWKARTRAMRERDKEERKQQKLASVQGSTIDVDKLWEEMNRPGPLPPVSVVNTDDSKPQPVVAAPKSGLEENPGEPEMITIKRTYKFAGEVHTEAKSVPKDSAEGKLWLAQQSEKTPALDAQGKTIRRPLRKISRFDPNQGNLDVFKGRWTLTQKAATGPKLNVVEKSKMDWAVHVDAEGLQEELAEHAKSKNSYLHQSDFLRSVSQRKDDEAREARLRGK